MDILCFDNGEDRICLLIMLSSVGWLESTAGFWGNPVELGYVTVHFTNIIFLYNTIIIFFHI